MGYNPTVHFGDDRRRRVNVELQRIQRFNGRRLSSVAFQRGAKTFLAHQANPSARRRICANNFSIHARFCTIPPKQDAADSFDRLVMAQAGERRPSPLTSNQGLSGGSLPRRVGPPGHGVFTPWRPILNMRRVALVLEKHGQQMSTANKQNRKS